MREAELRRETKETVIDCRIDLDGSGDAKISTGIGFFDHMLTLFAYHAGIDLKLFADGDLDVDDHHTVEDCGIVLGKVIREALGDRKGIARYGFFLLPMDETLAETALDISGRPYLVFRCDWKRDQIGMLSTEMIEEFFRALAVHAGITLHINVRWGENEHHKAEAIFKSFAHAFRAAVAVNGEEVLSTKGSLE